MDFKTLNLFCDLAETQSFSETARRHYLTQSAVSHKLKRLEIAFDCKLIDRGQGTFRLTEKGRILLEHSHQILAQYRQMNALLSRPLKHVGGRLRVAAMYTVGLYELPDYTTLFLNRYPKVDLQLKYMHTPEIYDALHANTIDIGIVDYPKSTQLIRQDSFTNQRLVLVVYPRHPWAQFDEISLRRLDGQPFISSPKELPRHQVLDKLFKKHHVHLRVVHSFDNIEVVKRAIISGVGISIIPEIAVREEVKNGTLCAIKFKEGPINRPVGILTRKDWELSVAAEKFVQTLKGDGS